jgi:energy-coupling factor transporter ATP-binding protein EcfA2/energy-coupling factor transporter transmembrane protein EcfT
VELVEAAALVDLVVAICLVARFLPFGWIMTIPAAVPAAVVALRWRARAVAAGLFAGAIVAFVLGGAGFTVTVAACVAIGGFLGTAFRRGWGLARTLAAALVILWLPLALGMDILFAAFAGLRTLVLAEIRNSWDGARHFLDSIGLPIPLGSADAFVRWGLVHWWALLPVALLCNGAFTVAAARAVSHPVLRRVLLAAPPAIDARDAYPDEPRGAEGGPGPLPARLEGVCFRYPGATEDALRDISITVEADEFLAIVGSNGSGKSTLARVLAGWRPTRGQVHRPGGAAPGRPGGTCMIFQRPESQVLGARVRDDVVWGMSDSAAVDVDALLARVGLAHLADRETASLSGGELQRLAVAAALARRPSLLVSDESTAMVDADGRGRLTELLARLPTEEGVAVVHVTHREAEAERANRRLVLHLGRQVLARPGDGASAVGSDAWGGPAAVPAARPVPQPERPPCVGAPATLRLERVGHVYSPRSPWARRALSDVTLTLAPGEAIVVRGRNGSGKSTVASIVAGLLDPSEGVATLGGRPINACPGDVGLAVQHARLQLLAATVGADVRGAGGVDAIAADEALRAVGLDPAVYRDRRVEALSGGQMRRVALAGLIARRPKLLILDEPLAGLDAASRRGLVEVLAGLRLQTGVTMFIVSHDLEGLGAIADRMLVLDEGRVAYDGQYAEAVPAAIPLPSAPVVPARAPVAAAARAVVAPAAAARAAAARAAAAGTIDATMDGYTAPVTGTHAAAPPESGDMPPESAGSAEPGGSAEPALSAVPSRWRRRDRNARRRTEPNLLRYIPGTSPVHRLWAGTKLVTIGALSVVLALRPTWPVIGASMAAVFGAMLLARIPRGAAPRLPRWFWIGMLLGALLTIQSKAHPLVHLGGMTLSAGGVLDWFRLTAVSITVFAAAAVLGWTTPMADLAPALAKLTAPLRRLRVPVDEWIGTLALSIRCLPLLVDEIQTLMSVRRLRAPEPWRGSRATAWRRHVRSAQELLTTALVVCLRRAQEMADAVTARGGFGAIAHRPASPKRADLLTMLLVAAAAAGALAA